MDRKLGGERRVSQSQFEKNIETIEVLQLIERATRAGREAAAKCVPPVMVVQGYEDQPIFDGPCGFAWVNVKPATCRVAKQLVAQGLAAKSSYEGGVTVWVSDYNQSMARKEAHARAFADVLRAGGVRAYANSRMD